MGDEEGVNLFETLHVFAAIDEGHKASPCSGIDAAAAYAIVHQGVTVTGQGWILNSS